MAKKSASCFAILSLIFILRVSEIATVHGKICEKPSKTWFGKCIETSSCDKQCIEWEQAKHGACHQRESKFMCFCYFDCTPAGKTKPTPPGIAKPPSPPAVPTPPPPPPESPPYPSVVEKPISTTGYTIPPIGGKPTPPPSAGGKSPSPPKAGGKSPSPPAAGGKSPSPPAAGGKSPTPPPAGGKPPPY